MTTPTPTDLITQSEAAMEKSVALTERLTSALQTVVGTGDLSKLTAGERVEYYGAACRSLGLNPFTRPFQFLSLQGKVVMYATKDCTDQIRAMHSISIAEPKIEFADGLVYVTVTGRTPAGRTDTEMGAVAIGAEAKGEVRANAMMKAITKAKRRLTLSLCGLGMLDESEIEDIEGYKGEPLVMNADTGALHGENGVPDGPESFASLKSARETTQTAPAPQKRAPRARQTVAGLTAQADAIEAASAPSVEEPPFVADEPAVAGDFDELPDDGPATATPEPGPMDPKPFADATAFIDAITALLEDTNAHKVEIGLDANSASATFAIAAQILGCERSRKGFGDFFERYHPNDSQIAHLRKELIRVLKGDVGTLE